MIQRTDFDHKIFGFNRRQILLIQSLSCFGSFSILSSGLVMAQTATSIDLVTPPTTKLPPAAKPVRSNGILPSSATTVPVIVKQAQTSPEVIQNNRLAPAQASSSINNESAYIDSTKYNIGATSSYEAPSRVVIMERSTGCKAVLQPGQGISSGNLCGAAAVPHFTARNSNAQPIASRVDPSRWNRNGEVTTAPLRSVAVGPISVTASGFRAATPPPVNTPVPVAPLSVGTTGAQPTQIQPVAVMGELALGSVTMPPQSGLSEYSSLLQNNAQAAAGYTGALPMVGQLRAANSGMLFPLSIPAPITSLFGWRIQPFTGERSFHPGTDLGAPLGTPVLAAYAGNVVDANYMGGYGLAIVLQHKKPAIETLYGHLSQIFVQPGQWVQQGTVIGQVGSTGLSTGPHLHFEIRQPTPDGWVAVDPGAQLQYAVARLVQVLHTAQAPRQSTHKG